MCGRVRGKRISAIFGRDEFISLLPRSGFDHVPCFGRWNTSKTIQVEAWEGLAHWGLLSLLFLATTEGMSLSYPAEEATWRRPQHPNQQSATDKHVYKAVQDHPAQPTHQLTAIPWVTPSKTNGRNHQAELSPNGQPTESSVNIWPLF